MDKENPTALEDMPWETMFGIVINQGDLSQVEKFYASAKKFVNVDARHFTRASKHGHLDIACWLLSHTSLAPQGRIWLDTAAKTKNLPFLQSVYRILKLKVKSQVDEVSEVFQGPLR